MKRLTWDAMRARAADFDARHIGSTDEHRRTQTFYNEFLPFSASTASDDRVYRAEPFASDRAGDRDRVESLFGRYATLIDPLTTAGVKANARWRGGRPFPVEW